MAERSDSEFSAGGVVVRGGDCIVIVPTRRAADGSRVLALPKGHPDGDESPADAARREVREETGVGGRLVRELDDDHYTDRKGRPKRVRWWLMQPIALDMREPDDEVDEVRWVPLADARELLSYAHDRALVADLGDA